MSDYLKQQLVGKVSELGDAVLLCTEVQTREWRRLAEMVIVVHRKTYPDAVIVKTLWMPQLPDFFRKKRDFLVNLQSGELMSVESSADFLHKGAPLDEMKPVSGELAATLAFCIDSFDAGLALRLFLESRKGGASGKWHLGRQVCCYDVADAAHPYFGMVILVTKD